MAVGYQCFLIYYDYIVYQKIREQKITEGYFHKRFFLNFKYHKADPCACSEKCTAKKEEEEIKYQ